VVFHSRGRVRTIITILDYFFFVFRKKKLIERYRMDQAREIDSDNELRLEDITRRSACDRCRGMKTRCERSLHRGIAQLAQCRRCVQAQAKCITTLEAQQQRTSQGDKSSGRNGKRPRTTSFDTFSLGLETTLGNLDQQYLLEYPSGDLTPSIPTFPSMQAGVQPENGLAPPGEIDLDQWHGFREMVNLEACSSQEAEGNDARTTATMPTLSSNLIRSSAPDNLDRQSFLERFTPPATAHSMSNFNPNKGTPGQASRPEQTRSMMDRLMEFNTLVSQDLQRAKEMVRARDHDKSGSDNVPGSGLAEMLKHSEMFVELIGRLRRPRKEGHSGNSMSSEEAGTHGTSNMDALGEKVDTDVALQLLSCNITVGNLYEILASELAAFMGLGREEAQGLPELRLEGLRNLDVEMRVSILAHICALMFMKIQNELSLMRSREILTPAAETTFQAVLGGSQERVTHIVENLRRLSSL